MNEIAATIRHKTFFCAILILFALVPSCSTPKPNRYAAEISKEAHHPNGLKLKIAESLRPIQTEHGFSIDLQETSGFRYAINFSVTVHQNENPPQTSAQQHTLENRFILFRQSNQESGGASGDEIIRTLTAWETIPNGYILYEQSTPETHFAQHGFDLLWHVAEGADY